MCRKCELIDMAAEHEPEIWEVLGEDGHPIIGFNELVGRIAKALRAEGHDENLRRFLEAARELRDSF